MQYASDRCAVTITKDLLLKDNSEFTLQNLRQQVADLFEKLPFNLSDEESLLDRGLDSIKIMSFVELLR